MTYVSYNDTLQNPRVLNDLQNRPFWHVACWLGKDACMVPQLEGTNCNLKSELAHRLDDLEARYDGQFKVVFDAIRQLMSSPEPPERRIGFHPDR
jgi:hypothetical protein